MIFPPAFLDSSSWNDNNNNNHNQQQQQQHAHGHHQHHQVAAGCGGGGGGGDGNSHELLQQQSMIPGTLADGGGGGGAVGPAKPMSMSERARLARIPLPEPGLKCPRCDSTNTKFCYFNNYSLSQPRHFCRACRRYWTRGGALRNVPVGGGYRRHAKRAKPKPASAAGSASAATTTAGSTPAGSTTTTTTSSTCATPNAPALPAMLGGNLSILPPLLRLADFDAMSLGSTFSGMAAARRQATARRRGRLLLRRRRHRPRAMETTADAELPVLPRHGSPGGDGGATAGNGNAGDVPARPRRRRPWQRRRRRRWRAPPCDAIIEERRLPKGHVWRSSPRWRIHLLLQCNHRRFTPKLIEAYNELVSQGKSFEVVFVSGDSDQDAFNAYFAKMPWLAVPFSDSEALAKLNERYKVMGIPHLVILG
ncbi:hypothetical protein OsJ_16868 [Oryza sativa Japonica Group]|uniref:Dof zinc finger protein n=2 Tax=Oryza sativa subsp. japonica TaxID=39947 RepID=B9FKB2_ORYSJ|nr:hypothetical protein OsJ_16868 [Oryza sativa Japonica Group]